MFESVSRYISEFMDNQRRCNRGQGIVEYAGALVIAAVVVSLVLAIFPNPFTDFFFTLVENILDMLMGYLPA